MSKVEQRPTLVMAGLRPAQGSVDAGIILKKKKLQSVHTILTMER